MCVPAAQMRLLARVIGGLMEAVALWLVLSIAIGMWASARGQKGFVGFAVAALFSPVVGAIFVVASRDRRADERHEQMLGALQGQRVQPDTRPCPRCAEDIKRAAKMCRFCQADVEPILDAPLPPPAPPAPAKRGDGPLLVGLIILILLVGLVGAISQLGSSANNTFTTISDAW